MYSYAGIEILFRFLALHGARIEIEASIYILFYRIEIDYDVLIGY